MSTIEQVLGMALVGLRAAVKQGSDDQVLLNVEAGIREIGLDPDRLHASALQSPDDSAHGSADADLQTDMIHRSPLARMRAALESFPGGLWSWEPHGDGWALYINRYAPIDPSFPSGFGNIQHGYNILTVDRGGFDSHAEALREFIIAASELASCPLVTIDRETLGMLVRDEWVKWAREQPNPKPSWLVPWEGLSEPDKEVDRRIGERIVREMRFLSRFTPKQIAKFDEDSGMTLDQAERWMMGDDKPRPKPTPEAVITAMLGAYAMAAAKAEVAAFLEKTEGSRVRQRLAQNEASIVAAAAARFSADGFVLPWLIDETDYQARLDGVVPLDAPPERWR